MHCIGPTQKKQGDRIVGYLPEGLLKKNEKFEMTPPDLGGFAHN